MAQAQPIERERVLVVEDDAATRVGLQQLVRGWGFAAEAAADGREALACLPTFRPGIILTDLVMPVMDGLALLNEVQASGEDITTVILTAQGTVETAVSAIKQGAYDYLTKPIDLQRLRILLDQIVERRDTLREVRTLRQQLKSHGTFGRMVGTSPAMREVYGTIEHAAPTDASVLISGESGTGKELVAQTLHRLSNRASGPFIAINCAAIPDTLLESELFGHERGAFTGATERRIGCFELAHRGTLFLDEIAEMTPTTQVKLLRVLQERTFRRLGGRQEQTVDIRVVAATNQEPGEAVKRGQLREDLFYRLNVFAIKLPPLRARKSDLPLLTTAMIEELNGRLGKSLVGIDDRVRRVFEEYGWPGNVRELHNVMERAAIVAAGPQIGLGDLPPALRGIEAAVPSDANLTPGTTVEEAEKRLILLTLEHTRGNKTRAAELLAISLKTLHNKLNRFRALDRGEEQ